ncbi:MAG: nonribosomal peptide synthetase MxaA [Pseudomonadota bacterium]|nr:nonribosomal peptide synthetase MxaA [Pseudomonadota bacterium]
MRIGARDLCWQATLSIACIFTACFPSLAPGAQSPIERFDFLTPRPFGYLIGDVIRHEIQLDVKKPYALQKGSIPTAGNLDYWLELRNVAVEEIEQQAANRYRILLTYQIFYAPVGMKALSIPAFRLVLSGPDQLDVPIPAWEFTMSPLRELAVRTEGGREYVRPDARPQPIDARGHGIRLILFAAAAAATLLYTLWRYGQWPGRRRKPFARAGRELRRLRRGAMDLTAYKQALQAIHRAFNETAGAPMFPGDLQKFIQQRPAFLPLMQEIEAFFERSRHLFFSEGLGEGMEGDAWRALERFCRRCRECEQASR